MTMFRPRGPMLHPRVAVLRRPSGAVQLGWDPERAVVVQPHGIAAESLTRFLKLLDGLRSHPQIIWQASGFGIASSDALRLLHDIDRAGLLVHPHTRVSAVRKVHVHGRGPLSEAVAAGVRRLGLRPSRSRDLAAGAGVGRTADVVVLADTLVPEPHLVNDLVLRRIPHLQIRLRDGRGVVGPLVLPGGTSCLRCADLTRRDLDAEWPHLAAQLLGRVGYGSPATIAATAALALRELETVLEGGAETPPRTLDTTLELDPETHHINHRRWPPHPACACRALLTAPPR
ncbi:TOMM precursor leader peptide-binding protein [Nocardia blacklockiae]|uniref:TOMM precursor leader peptide-binding protein n=1 Tax=Nocardia blacklockiae TaxID=480036 RepID=UPI001895BA10|nr:TOMM precursor leader peptide-binding protein [Nocardia blacklockiae]MBF6174721.1 TOMM precursor leader peptide-binding protein [Nocardia blacklockiae]